MTAMIGATVSHYKILEKIGEGGMGEVFVAEDTKLRRKVALKFLPADLMQDASRKQRFLQEARVAASLEHPHIAAVYDIDEIDGRTFMVMEYVRGKSLRETMLENRLSLRRSLELGTQIAEGLAKAHERGIVHRDLKPENVLVSEDGYAKIIDFGLAKLAEPVPAIEQERDGEHEAETLIKTREGLVLGTVAYMSPEQARAKSVDARTDVFSLGVVLHEMLTGDAPFSRGSVAETLSAILKESPPELPGQVASTTPELPPTLRKALAKSPEDRYARMKELAVDLRTIREELGSAARPPVARRPGRGLQYVALALLVLGLAGAATYFWRDHQQPGIGSAGRPAIAVMYFEDNSGSEEIRWLSNGLPPALENEQQRNAQSIFTELLAGTAEARSGDVEAARARWEAQKDIFEPDRQLLTYAFRALEGEIAIMEGDLSSAAAAFSAAEPEIKMHLHMTGPVESLAANNPPMRDGLARVKKAQGDLPGAIEIYRRLLTPDIRSKWTGMLEPRHVLGLARLLDQSGDTAAARAEYQRFLDLWKDADADLPELDEARAYLERTLNHSS